MGWAKVDDRLHGHIKAQRAGEAMALWVLALSWCCAYLTDGEVPADLPKRLYGRRGERWATRLVEVKLWEKTEVGFKFSSWSEYQTERSTVEAKRAEARTRMQRVRGVSSDVRANKQRSSLDVREKFAVGSRSVREPYTDTDTDTDTEEREEKKLSETRAPEALAHPAPTPKGKRPKPAPVADVVPLPGTKARKVYDAITGDSGLRAITADPGDLAERLVAICDGSSVDPTREVVALGGWLREHPGRWSDGRKALIGNVKRKVDEEARRPKPQTPPQSSVKAPPVAPPRPSQGPFVPPSVIGEMARRLRRENAEREIAAGARPEDAELDSAPVVRIAR